MVLSRIEYIQNDQKCNYVDLENMSAQSMLYACSSQPNQPNPTNGTSGTNNLSIVPLPKEKKEEKKVKDVTEGFSSDMSTEGSGISYVPQGSCYDGYYNIDGKCIQLARGRARDSRYQYGTQIDVLSDGKENYQICGKDKFLGLENGFIKCENDPDNNGLDITPFDTLTKYFSSFFS